MRKVLIGTLLIVILVFIGVNAFSDSEYKSDGLNINNTYVDGSTELVTDISVSGHLLQNKKIQFKVLLEENNVVSLKKEDNTSDMTLKITSEDGDMIFSETIIDSHDFSFEAAAGEGELELELSNGDHEFVIMINGENQ
ncbi:hypothetical protein MM221_10545 [Salipaludibacillus sp. LMS25]|uniref:hypothetical protein n=1 Tax=Salipaludibacillus sp. LMS25 TaxID=2924031 RepID=UPI0020D0906F|nr:hypothetical protein [Salipaludibacillus sp. LMS25]UTR16906.1 hypothetical protein MM221_10545 [Salipaludibacillus sp. LMS25]